MTVALGVDLGLSSKQAATSHASLTTPEELNGKQQPAMV